MDGAREVCHGCPDGPSARAAGSASRGSACGTITGPVRTGPVVGSPATRFGTTEGMTTGPVVDLAQTGTKPGASSDPRSGTSWTGSALVTYFASCSSRMI